MASAASAATALGLRPGQQALHTMQQALQIAVQPPARPNVVGTRLPPSPPHRLRAAAPAALPARGYRSRPREPPAERDEEHAEPRDEYQLWKDRLAGMRPTERSAAVAQLLRIEEEGAYAGLVSHAACTAMYLHALTNARRSNARSCCLLPAGLARSAPAAAPVTSRPALRPAHACLPCLAVPGGWLPWSRHG